MNKIQLELERGNYTVEFDRETLKKADRLGANSAETGLIERIQIILYSGLLKNHPNITRKNAERVFDSICEEYDTEEFIEALTELYTDGTNKCFFASGSGKKKLFNAD